MSSGGPLDVLVTCILTASVMYVAYEVNNLEKTFRELGQS